MFKVTNKPRSARTTSRDLHRFMDQQRISSSTLAWILRCSRWRAIRLRHGSSSWMLDEVLALVDACRPSSTSIPVFGQFADARA